MNLVKKEHMENQAGQLTGQVAIVTGGSRGLGEAISKKLGSIGVEVLVNYVARKDAADQVVANILENGGKAKAFQFDVASPEQVEAGFQEMLAYRGRIDILINNAGIASDSLLVRTKASDWQRTIDVNLSSCFYCARIAVKPMLKARGGRIVNITSVIGEMGNAGQAAYAASKAGMIGFTKSLARELGSRNITVNAIAPGYIETEMTASFDKEGREKLIEQIPLSRLGQPEDIAEVVAFLCSPGASYITGQVIGVNGGMYM